MDIGKPPKDYSSPPIKIKYMLYKIKIKIQFKERLGDSPKSSLKSTLYDTKEENEPIKLYKT